MGSHISIVVIRPGDAGDAPGLIRDLGFQDAAALGEAEFITGSSPGPGGLWIAQQDDLLIIGGELAFEFFNTEPDDVRRALFRRFPDAEITALVLYDVTGLWGYSIFRGGELVRRWSGSYDQPVIDEAGQQQPFETEFLAPYATKFGAKTIYRTSSDAEVTGLEGFGSSLTDALLKKLLGHGTSDNDLYRIRGTLFTKGGPRVLDYLSFLPDVVEPPSAWRSVWRFISS